MLSPALVVLKGLFALTALAFYRIDARAPFKARGYPKNYVILATKA